MAKHFDKLFVEFLETGSSEITSHLKQKYNESNSSSYYDFLENYLFDYGLQSIAIDWNDGVKYKPYLFYRKENIFKKEKGKVYLGTYSTKKASQEQVANELISQLNFMTPSSFKNLDYHK